MLSIKPENILRYAMGCIIACAASVFCHAQNPYLPMWEYIPDGEPYVFDDPDNPGKKRVYIYGSHDIMITGYCGRDIMGWSAPVEDLSQWRCDGVIFEVKTNAEGKYMNPSRLGDVLYAPDVTEVTQPDGTKTYYLYPNNMMGGRRTMVAKASRPDGPFTVCNWSKDNPNETTGILEFDPAVFCDDDGRIYGYWGFDTSYAAELDPQTMATLKPGTEIIENLVSNRSQQGDFRFFEASSMRKIKDKYVFIYSRWTKDGEFGLPQSNYTLAYAYGDSPLGPFTYGGTLIDGRARDTNPDGDTIFTATPNSNTHGSICQINGQWYVFYHRQTGTDEYARQPMVAPIDVYVEEGPGGKVVISEAEYTSEGFAASGLHPLRKYSAGIACHFTGPRPAESAWPNKTFYGSYIKTVRYGDGKYETPYDLKYNHNPMINNTAGSVVGYKYFNLTHTKSAASLQLELTLLPQGVSGRIDIMVDSPWEEKGGKRVGTVMLHADMPQQLTTIRTDVSTLTAMSGKHAIYFLFHAEEKDTPLCELHYLQFLTP